MNFDNNQFIVIAFAISNLVGLLILWAAVKKPKLARLLFLLLFAWASWTNYKTCHLHPEYYLEYSLHALGFYKSFINGWFRDHITLMVTAISIGQLAIAAGMSLKGILVNLACTGAIIFLLAIAPLGIYAAFPFSITTSLAAWFILKNDDKDYLWRFDKK